MRILGVKLPLDAFRWDLIYLLAQLTSDDRSGIAELAPAVQTGLDEVNDCRNAWEQAQAAAIVTSALVAKRDRGRDRLIIEMGGIARAMERAMYEQLFPRLSPSRTAELGIESETSEVQRLLGELNRLEDRHPLRQGYETSLRAAQSSLQAAKAQDDSADTALELQRSNVRRVKMNIDRLRLETHGKLLALLADKAEADAFFRPTQSAPGQTEDKDEQEPGG